MNTHDVTVEINNGDKVEPFERTYRVRAYGGAQGAAKAVGRRVPPFPYGYKVLNVTPVEE